MFSQPWQITVYTKKSLEILPGFFFPPPLSLSNSRAGLCTQETTSHFPSFHVWNFSCTRHASSTLYSLSWSYKWRLGYKFSAWCHWSGTCQATDRRGANITVQSAYAAFKGCICFKSRRLTMSHNSHRADENAWPYSKTAVEKMCYVAGSSQYRSHF